MLTKDRMKYLRHQTGLRSEDFAHLLEVGVATIFRWESSSRATLPSGLPRRIYQTLDRLEASGRDLAFVSETLSRKGNLETIRLLLNEAHALEQTR